MSLVSCNLVKLLMFSTVISPLTQGMKIAPTFNFLVGSKNTRKAHTQPKPGPMRSGMFLFPCGLDGDIHRQLLVMLLDQAFRARTGE